jgi:hypothetical protein
MARGYPRKTSPLEAHGAFAGHRVILWHPPFFCEAGRVNLAAFRLMVRSHGVAILSITVDRSLTDLSSMLQTLHSSPQM